VEEVLGEIGLGLFSEPGDEFGDCGVLVGVEASDFELDASGVGVDVFGGWEVSDEFSDGVGFSAVVLEFDAESDSRGFWSHEGGESRGSPEDVDDGDRF
jgi:hypothetical protein